MRVLNSDFQNLSHANSGIYFVSGRWAGGQLSPNLSLALPPEMLATAAVKTAFLEVGVVYSAMF